MRRMNSTGGWQVIGLAAALGCWVLPAAAATSDFNDWIGWDWRLDQPQMVQVYLFKDIQPPKPWQQYLQAVTYDAELDSLGLADFLALPESQRTARQRLAREEYEKARHFRNLVNQVWQDNLQNLSLFDGRGWQKPSGVGEGITRTLHHLINASGLDPSDPLLWYDLSYFAGVIGDRIRCQASFDAALAVLPAVTDRDGVDSSTLQIRIALDYAWLLREDGHYDACLAWLVRADSLITGKEPLNVDAAREQRLITGLVQAERGDILGARSTAASLRQIKTWIRQKWTHIDGHARLSVGRPVNKNSWESRLSEFASNWIRAWTYLRQGDEEGALGVLVDPKISVFRELPPGLNHRYWNDIGHVYEHFGYKEKARLCYGFAAVYRPYFIYYPLIGARGLARVHGQAGTGTPYFLAYRHFYLAGGLFSYAANAALACEAEPDPTYRRQLAVVALSSLAACRRRDIRPTSALTLQARVHYFLGDYAQAEKGLTLAYEELGSKGRDNVDVCLLLGLAKFNRADYRGSLPWLERFTELRPEMGLGWRALGLASAYAGEEEMAFAAFDSALALEPASASAWFNRGLLNLREQRWSQAQTDLRRAAELWPANEDIARILVIAQERRAMTINLEPSRFQLQISRQDSLRLAQLRAGASLNLAEEMTAGGEEITADWLAVDAAGAQELLASLEAAYATEPTRTHRGKLAWGFLRTDQPSRARDLLLPLWEEGIAVEELCLLLEADRALGDPTRARLLAGSLQSDPAPVPDASLWELVALICLDHGLNDLGGQALEAAIALDPTNTTLHGMRSLLE